MDINVEAVYDETAKYINGYKLNISLSNDTVISKKVSEKQLNELLDNIQSVLGFKEIMEKFSCNLDDARTISKRLGYSDCKKCDLRMKECYRCCIVCESPLETAMLQELVRNNIPCKLQLRINKDGSVQHYPEEVNPDTILTLPDFYIETETKKICVYTDGHTYHERTEYQAVRDRSIDRELQNLGYEVLRFTTSEVNQHMKDKVIPSIKKAMEVE